jgi:glycosyltransferase involved in cell wall biosynthesis
VGLRLRPEETDVATLKVGFDDQIFVAQARGGFSKYFVELIKRLPEHDVEPVLLPRWTRNLHLGESGLAPRAAEQGPLARRRDWFMWRLIGHPRAQARVFPQLDVMHHTFSHPAYLRSWSGPRVFTVVDMTPELFPHLFKLGNPHLAKKAYCNAADAIVSISDSTADDLARLYGDSMRAKTSTVHFGVGEEFLGAGSERRLTLPDRYGLFVGVRSGYKDFETAVATMARVRSVDAHRDLKFVMVGGGPLTAAESTLLARHGLGGDTSHLRLADDDMPEVYAGQRSSSV